MRCCWPPHCPVIFPGGWPIWARDAALRESLPLHFDPILKSCWLKTIHAWLNWLARRQNLQKNAFLRARIEVLEADVTLSGAKRQQAGLMSSSFDYVIMNPPYHDGAANKPSQDQIRAQAHIMGGGGLDAWMRTATAILKPGGMLAMIYRSQSIGQIIAATQGRFGNLTITPVYPRFSEPAKLLVACAIKGSKGSVTFGPPIFIHNEDGTFTAKAKAVLAGEEILF